MAVDFQETNCDGDLRVYILKNSVFSAISSLSSTVTAIRSYLVVTAELFFGNKFLTTVTVHRHAWGRPPWIKWGVALSLPENEQEMIQSRFLFPGDMSVPLMLRKI